MLEAFKDQLFKISLQLIWTILQRVNKCTKKRCPSGEKEVFSQDVNSPPSQFIVSCFRGQCAMLQTSGVPFLNHRTKLNFWCLFAVKLRTARITFIRLTSHFVKINEAVNNVFADGISFFLKKNLFQLVNDIHYFIWAKGIHWHDCETNTYLVRLCQRKNID